MLLPPTTVNICAILPLFLYKLSHCFRDCCCTCNMLKWALLTRHRKNYLHWNTEENVLIWPRSPHSAHFPASAANCVAALTHFAAKNNSRKLKTRQQLGKVKRRWRCWQCECRRRTRPASTAIRPSVRVVVVVVAVAAAYGEDERQHYCIVSNGSQQWGQQWQQNEQQQACHGE